MKTHLPALGLCCTLALSLCACARQQPPTPTMAEVVAANSTKTLLAQYGSFLCTALYEGEVSSTVYADDTLCYDSQQAFEEITSDEYRFVHEGDEYYGYLVADGSYNPWGDQLVLGPESSRETIVETRLAGDDLLLMTEPDPETAQETIKELFARLGADGTRDLEAMTGLRYQYRIDSKTLAARELTSLALFADGTTQTIDLIQVEYGVPRPAQAQALLAACRPESDLRTLTVVLDPNTAREQVFTQTVRKGDPFSVILPSGYQLYADESCTVPSQPSNDWNAHVLLYAKPTAATTETAAAQTG